MAIRKFLIPREARGAKSKDAATAIKAAIALAFGLFTALPAAAAPMPIKIGLPGLSIGYGFYYIARDEGFFAKNGIDASFAFLADDTLAAGLVSNGIQVTPLAGSTISAAMAGFKVKNIGLLEAKLSWMVVSDTSIATLQGLKGKKVITSPPKAAPNVLLNFLLTKGGVDPASVQHLSIGSVAARQQLMLAGRADAILDDVNSALQLEAQMKTVHTLVPSSDMPDQVGTGIGVADDFLASHPDIVKGMLRALAEASAFMKSHPQEAAAALSPDLKMPLPIARASMPVVVSDFSPTLVPAELVYDNEALLRTMAGGNEGKPVTAADIKATFDTRLAAEVDKEMAGK